MVNGNVTKPQRNQWLDVLRGLAILGVVAVHAIQYTDGITVRHSGHVSTLISNTISYGKYGVELFFFLSGWLLASIYGIKGVGLGKAYWVRRAARIMPLWILFLIVQIIGAHAGETHGWASARSLVPGEYSVIHSPIAILILTITFTLWISSSLWNSVIPGGWSIQAEVGHYILFPALRKFGLGKIITWASWCNLFTFIIYLSTQSLYKINLPRFAAMAINAWVRFDLFATFGYFLLGVFCFCSYSEFRKTGKLQSILKENNISNISIFLFTISFLIVPLNFGNQPEALGYVIVMIVMSVGIYQILRLKKLFTFLGKYSYFIYFCHFQVLYILAHFINHYHFSLTSAYSQPVIFTLLLTSTLFISAILAIPSFRFFENPILKKAHLIK